MTLSNNQVNNICLLGDGENQCRYLASDDADYSKYHCLKHKKDLASKIDVKVSNYLNAPKNPNHWGIAPSFPCGDNCKGYPVLKHIQQGYDCK